MRTPIAEVRLALGNVGWFDPLTNIHLTMQRPIGQVFAGQNTENIRRGIAFNTIILTAGSLEPAVNITEGHGQIPSGPAVHVTNTPPVAEPMIEEVVTEEVKVDVLDDSAFEKFEVKPEVAINEEVVAEIVEEVVEEKPKKKAAPKKKTAAKK